MDIEDLVKRFVDKQEKQKKYIYRLNEHSSQLLTQFKVKKLKIDGVIDSSIKEEVVGGIPVIHDLSEIDKDSLVINCVVNIWPQTVQRKILEAGMKAIDLFSFLKWSDYQVEIYQFKGFAESYQQHRDEYNSVREKFADSESRIVFDSIIRLRTQYDFSALSIFKENQINQYFEPFLGLKPEGEVFVDIGGFEGETTIRFAKECPNYAGVYFFEPEPSIMKKAKQALVSYPRVDYFEIAASDKKETLYFESNTSGSKVTADGQLKIQADAIDHLDLKGATYLKMDIEGSESAAIDGAINTILRYHPRLAICVYHKGADLIDIPNQVLSIRDDYDLYLRHYTEGLSETVMFFVPK